MESGLIDSSKYQITTHSLDSRFSDLKNNANSEFRIRNQAPLKNIVRVRLASIELPFVEHAFSAAKGNDTFSVKIGNGIRFIQSTRVPPGNYTAGALVSVVQTMLQAIHSSFTCVLSPISGFITISNPVVSFTMDFSSLVQSVAARPSHWGLGYYLGFRDSLVSSAFIDNVYTIVTTSVINVQATPYYLLQLKCPEDVVNVIHRLNNETYVDAFAKLVLRDNYYQLQFDDGSNLLRKEYTFLAPITVPFFQVRLLDPWGELVDMLDADWSLTIEVTEIVNSKTFAEISKTYARK
jgi:hypothetical protein